MGSLSARPPARRRSCVGRNCDEKSVVIECGASLSTRVTDGDANQRRPSYDIAARDRWSPAPGSAVTDHVTESSRNPPIKSSQGRQPSRRSKHLPHRPRDGWAARPQFHRLGRQTGPPTRFARHPCRRWTGCEKRQAHPAASNETRWTDRLSGDRDQLTKLKLPSLLKNPPEANCLSAARLARRSRPDLHSPPAQRIPTRKRVRPDQEFTRVTDRRVETAIANCPRATTLANRL